MAKTPDPTFRVQFVSQDKVFEVFAKQIIPAISTGSSKWKSLSLVSEAAYLSIHLKKN